MAIERHDMLQNYHWANNRELMRLTCMSPYPKSAHDIDRWFEQGVDTPSSRVLAIKEMDGEYLGNIELRDIDSHNGRAEIGIFLGAESSRGKGRGAEAIRLMCQFAFSELRLHRVYAKILASNSPARRAFESCGFELEGTERQAIFQRGKYLDVCIYGLLATKKEE